MNRVPVSASKRHAPDTRPPGKPGGGDAAHAIMGEARPRTPSLVGGAGKTTLVGFARRAAAQRRVSFAARFRASADPRTAAVGSLAAGPRAGEGDARGGRRGPPTICRPFRAARTLMDMHREMANKIYVYLDLRAWSCSCRLGPTSFPYHTVRRPTVALVSCRHTFMARSFQKPGTFPHSEQQQREWIIRRRPATLPRTRRAPPGARPAERGRAWT